MRRIAFLLAALSVAAAFTAAATGGERLKRHVVRGEGVSLAVPAPWVAVDRRAVLTTDIVERLARQNPALAPFIRPIAQPNSPLKFIAFDPVVRGKFATNVNVVVVVPLATTPTFADYRRALVAEIRVLVGSGTIRQAVVKIGGVRALRLRYRFRLTSGTRYTVQTLQYAFLRDRRSVVVTYTTLPGQAPRYEQTFRASAASIRFSR